MKNKNCIFIVCFFLLSNFVQRPTKQPEKTYINASNNVVERWIIRKITKKIQKISTKNKEYNTNPTKKLKSKFKIKHWLKGLLICVGAYLIAGIALSLIFNSKSLSVGNNMLLILLATFIIIILLFVLIYGFVMFIKGLVNNN